MTEKAGMSGITEKREGVSRSRGDSAGMVIDALSRALNCMLDGNGGSPDSDANPPGSLSPATLAGRLVKLMDGSGAESDAVRLYELLKDVGRLTGAQKAVIAKEALAAVGSIRTAAVPVTGNDGSGDREVDTNVQYAKGIGPRRAKTLAKLGINTIRDALYYFPFRYEDRSNLKPIMNVVYGETETVTGEVVGSELVTTRRKRIKLFELTIRDKTGFLTGVWFNQPYLAKNFKEGDSVMLTGVPKPDGYNRSRIVMENPDYEVMTGGPDDSVHTGRIVPVYRLTAGVGQRGLRSMMKSIVDRYAGSLSEYLPEGFHGRYMIPELADSVREVHFPESERDMDTLNRMQSRAHKRLVFDEFFILQLGLAMLKRGRSDETPGKCITGGEALMEEYLKSLPFEPTPAQRRVIEEIARDMRLDRPMNRLVQGDVGCGKTVVAVASIANAVGAGYQAALMAPTEILAEQHYLNVKDTLDLLGIKTVLLTSSLTRKRREEALEAVSGGEAGLVVGTHSLIQDDVFFRNLGLAVIDEQHRFGVMQRAVLRDKGDNPDVLVMTATPIPRTLALTVYGDLDVSVIDTLPPGRTPITTRLFDDGSRSEAYKMVLRELAADRQVYIVYPLVEESERSDLKAAKEGAEELAAGVFAKYEVGLLHGRMKPAEKEAVMYGFRAGEIDVLVATTVVEVGVDVPNATVMLIEHAERFGLAQLHQLRGRVGRGEHRSYCIMVSAAFTETSRERLSAMMKSSNGFDIAEEDLRIRGPGEFIGTRQSGLPDLVLGNIIRDARIIDAARREAFGIIEKDPHLDDESHCGLRKAVKKKWDEKLGIATIG